MALFAFGGFKGWIVKTLVMSFMALISTVFTSPAASGRGEEESDEHQIISLPAGEVVNKDYFAAGRVIEVFGTVNGDVYAVGGKVIINGRINGDLLAAGGTVSIGGRITQDVRAAGGQITINGDIGRNFTVAGGNVEFTDSAKIRGGLVAAGGSIGLAAPIGKDVKIAAGNVTVSGPIQGNLDLAAGEIRLTSRAVIHGNLTYRSGRPASIDHNAKIGGARTHKSMTEVSGPSAGMLLGALVGLVLLVKLVSFVSTLVLGLLLIYLFPLSTQGAGSIIKTRPWASIGLGLIVLVMTPVVAGILAATVLGIPLALILTALYLIGLYLVRVFVILWAGSALFEKLGWGSHTYWAFVIALVAYSLLTLIPFVGGSLALLVILLGLGATLLAQRQLYQTAG